MGELAANVRGAPVRIDQIANPGTPAYGVLEKAAPSGVIARGDLQAYLDAHPEIGRVFDANDWFQKIARKSADAKSFPKLELPVSVLERQGGPAQSFLAAAATGGRVSRGELDAAVLANPEMAKIISAEKIAEWRAAFAKTVSIDALARDDASRMFLSLAAKDGHVSRDDIARIVKANPETAQYFEGEFPRWVDLISRASIGERVELGTRKGTMTVGVSLLHGGADRLAESIGDLMRNAGLRANKARTTLVQSIWNVSVQAAVDYTTPPVNDAIWNAANETRVRFNDARYRIDELKRGGNVILDVKIGSSINFGNISSLDIRYISKDQYDALR